MMDETSRQIQAEIRREMTADPDAVLTDKPSAYAQVSTDSVAWAGLVTLEVGRTHPDEMVQAHIHLTPEQARYLAVRMLNAADELDPQAAVATAVDLNFGPGGVTITPAPGAKPGRDWRLYGTESYLP